MSRDDDSGFDLLVRARRDLLAPGEERHLLEVLASSSETRLLFEAGCAFDREAPVIPGDDARIERMVRGVEQRRERSRVPPRPRAIWQALAVGMLIGGAAVAAGEASKALLWPSPPLPGPVSETHGASAAVKNAPGEPPVVDRAAPVSSAGTSVPPALSSRAPLERRESSVPVAAHTVAEVEPSQVRAIAPNASARPSSGQETAFPSARFEDTAPDHASEARASTATELFRAANQARMQADPARAIARYVRLQAEFPQSAEALNARLSLGMLYLHTGQAGLALEQFRAYRALGRGPTLGEALWGQSLALHELGRRTEESGVLRELLEGFPQSAYAGAARKRLSEP